MCCAPKAVEDMAKELEQLIQERSELKRKADHADEEVKSLKRRIWHIRYDDAEDCEGFRELEEKWLLSESEGDIVAQQLLGAETVLSEKKKEKDNLQRELINAKAVEKFWQHLPTKVKIEDFHNNEEVLATVLVGAVKSIVASGVQERV